MFEYIFIMFFLLATITVLGYLLGVFIGKSFNNTSSNSKIEHIFNWLEQPIYKFLGVNPSIEMGGIKYFLTLFISNIVLSAFCFGILYFQSNLPYNGGIHYKLQIPLIWHIISSLITNTCQTHHIPESQLTPLSNFLIMPILMFYSSASGIATGIATMRGITLGTLGNAYADLIRALIRILIPLSLIGSVFFTALGTPNTFTNLVHLTSLEDLKENLILGPVAAFEAIKLIGENGLSCFNVNSAHPFENPNYTSNFLQLICILTIPIALIFTLGIWLKNIKQSIIIISALLIVLTTECTLVSYFELQGNSMINSLIHTNEPNWVGKETRLGIIGSSIFQTTISNVSGSSNSALDSYHPIINLFGLFNLSNQSVFGVQGFGLVFTIAFILYTTFYIGLMLGKTPELFNKRIEKNEMIICSILFLTNPVLVFLGIILTLTFFPESYNTPYEKVHYYTKVFYELVSGASSNGSGLESLDDNNNYWNILSGLVMFIARYIAMGGMIALGSSFSRKVTIPATTSDFRTDSILFGGIFLITSVISTALIYLPFLVMGPITEILIPK